MPESTLSLSYDEIRAEVGHFLGYGRDVTAWVDSEALADARRSERKVKRENIESCLRSGMRQFYYPPPLFGERMGHDWTFLHPTSTMALVSGTHTYELPSDFGGVEGPVTFADSDSRGSARLLLVNEGIWRKNRQELPDLTGQPRMVSFRPKAGVGTKQGQRHELMVFPTPSEAFTLAYNYYMLPDALTDSRPYPLGGAAHAETILASCLAIAEQRLDDAQGTQKALFMERLAASIGADRKHQSGFLSHRAGRVGRAETRDRIVTTYNSVEYE